MDKNAKIAVSELFKEKIREAKVKEELAIPIYISHIRQSFFWSGLAPEKQKKIISGLKLLEKESKNHARIFAALEKKYL